ncbi:MAG TPA: hypothetical protein PLV68_17770, partial [Ilumatobacteraceae bacterium]|nr:hypothetical protein [Ilumatobacteraceae bacterium]
MTSVNISVVGEIATAFGIDNSAGQTIYDQTSTPVLVDPQVVVSGGGTLDGAKVTITDGFLVGEDELSCAPMHGITCDYNATTGVLTLTGNATPAQYQAILRTVLYDNSGVSPSGGTRTIQFSLGAAGLYFEPNGHFYEFVVANGITWSAARDAAAARRYFGLQGYLATVTDETENSFIAAKLEGQGWMGASDAAAEGTWRWVTGPEGLENAGAGRHFWSGTATGGPVGGFYNNWASGEPNNCCAGENHAHFLGNGSWNDYAFNNGSIQGYVVEYGGLGGDPVIEVVDTKELLVVTCFDGLKNGVETDADCGGVCGSCGPGGACGGPADCESGGNICQLPACNDGVKNGLETGTDCGGPTCGDCGIGGGCFVGTDCTTGVCINDVCQAPTCNDGVSNGLETGTDCGGPVCGDCGPGEGCIGASDCSSGVCAGGACQAPSCFDE